MNNPTPRRVITEVRQVDPNYERKLIGQRCFSRTQMEADLAGTVVFLSSSEIDFMSDSY